METASIVGIILISALLGSWKKTHILSSTATPTTLSKGLMVLLLIISLIPFSTVVTLSVIRDVDMKIMIACALGGYTCGYFYELIRLTTYRPTNRKTVSKSN